MVKGWANGAWENKQDHSVKYWLLGRHVFDYVNSLNNFPLLVVLKTKYMTLTNNFAELSGVVILTSENVMLDTDRHD